VSDYVLRKDFSPIETSLHFHQTTLHFLLVEKINIWSPRFTLVLTCTWRTFSTLAWIQPLSGTFSLTMFVASGNFYSLKQRVWFLIWYSAECWSDQNVKKLMCFSELKSKNTTVVCANKVQLWLSRV